MAEESSPNVETSKLQFSFSYPAPLSTNLAFPFPVSLLPRFPALSFMPPLTLPLNSFHFRLISISLYAFVSFADKIFSVQFSFLFAAFLSAAASCRLHAVFLICGISHCFAVCNEKPELCTMYDVQTSTSVGARFNDRCYVLAWHNKCRI